MPSTKQLKTNKPTETLGTCQKPRDRESSTYAPYLPWDEEGN